jgi:hypothetical protein
MAGGGWQLEIILPTKGAREADFGLAAGLRRYKSLGETRRGGGGESLGESDQTKSI